MTRVFGAGSDPKRHCLRLDCAKHNARLRTYYDAHGFTHVRTVDLAHRESGALFERRSRIRLG